MIVYVAHHAAKTSIAVEARNVVRILGSTLVLRKGRRIRTGHTEEELRIIFNRARLVDDEGSGLF